MTIFAFSNPYETNVLLHSIDSKTVFSITDFHSKTHFIISLSLSKSTLICCCWWWWWWWWCCFCFFCDPPWLKLPSTSPSMAEIWYQMSRVFSPFSKPRELWLLLMALCLLSLFSLLFWLLTLLLLLPFLLTSLIFSLGVALLGLIPLMLVLDLNTLLLFLTFFPIVRFSRVVQ